ncbi:MAG: haloacid dehalogenase-like hydrolase, partial [Planctomycetota bacterium]
MNTRPYACSFSLRSRTLGLAVVLAAILGTVDAEAQDRCKEPPSLPSWNDTGPRQAIVDFVMRVTTEGSADFVPVAERIAVFDNDGCLWCEQPLYFQLFFALDRVKALAEDHPEWREQQPFAAILADDKEALAKLTEHDAAAIVAATHAGITTDEFAAVVQDWLKTARHPVYDRPYTELTYQPML